MFAREKDETLDYAIDSLKNLDTSKKVSKTALGSYIILLNAFIVKLRLRAL